MPYTERKCHRPVGLHPFPLSIPAALTHYTHTHVLSITHSLAQKRPALLTAHVAHDLSSLADLSLRKKKVLYVS